jgi:hypothetical protein
VKDDPNSNAVIGELTMIIQALESEHGIKSQQEPIKPQEPQMIEPQ